ncbi:MAG: hypothetical protein ACI32O_02425 [Enterococcus sp.]|nr:hypothetical protein [Enterococcus sp. 10A9_DIV0425]
MVKNNIEKELKKINPVTLVGLIFYARFSVFSSYIWVNIFYYSLEKLSKR